MEIDTRHLQSIADGRYSKKERLSAHFCAQYNALSEQQRAFILEHIALSVELHRWQLIQCHLVEEFHSKKCRPQNKKRQYTALSKEIDDLYRRLFFNNKNAVFPEEFQDQLENMMLAKCRTDRALQAMDLITIYYCGPWIDATAPTYFNSDEWQLESTERITTQDRVVLNRFYVMFLAFIARMEDLLTKAGTKKPRSIIALHKKLVKTMTPISAVDDGGDSSSSKRRRLDKVTPASLALANLFHLAQAIHTLVDGFPVDVLRLCYQMALRLIDQVPCKFIDTTIWFRHFRTQEPPFDYPVIDHERSFVMREPGQTGPSRLNQTFLISTAYCTEEAIQHFATQVPKTLWVHYEPSPVPPYIYLIVVAHKTLVLEKAVCFARDFVCKKGK